MKAEIKLNIDVNGFPCIRIRHHNKSGSVEQELLRVFLEAVNESGLQLVKTFGHVTPSGESQDNYEIRIGKINQ
jgi:hypothetical protein